MVFTYRGAPTRLSTRGPQAAASPQPLARPGDIRRRPKAGTPRGPTYKRAVNPLRAPKPPSLPRPVLRSKGMVIPQLPGAQILLPIAAFELGYSIGTMLHILGQDIHWDANEFAGYGINPCGGHSPATVGHMLSHLAAIGTGFAGNCSFTWPISQGVDGDGHMVGFEGTRTGPFRAMYREPATSPPFRLRLCSIVTVGTNPVNHPWPTLKPATAPVFMPDVNPLWDWVADAIRDNPAAAPIGQPAPFPSFPPWYGPWAPPGGQESGPAPAPNPWAPPVAPPVIEYTEVSPIVTPGGVPKPAPRPKPNARPQRPGPKVKERKMRLYVRGLPATLLGHLTEGLDFLEVLHDSLKLECRAGPNWQAGGNKWSWRRVQRQGPKGNPYWKWVRERGINLPPTPQQKAEAVYKNIECLDLSKAMWGLLYEQLEDAVFGGIGQVAGNANKHKPFGVGIQFGPAL